MPPTHQRCCPIFQPACRNERGHAYSCDRAADRATFALKSHSHTQWLERHLTSYLSALRLLIADDEEPVRAVFAAAISARIPNATLLLASNGQEALEQARNYAPEIIVMDLAMPILDGLEATRLLKKDPRTALIPVMAFTGRVWDSQAVLDAGCTALLTKPVTAEAMLGRISALLRNRRTDPRRSE